MLECSECGRRDKEILECANLSSGNCPFSVHTTRHANARYASIICLVGLLFWWVLADLPPLFIEEIFLSLFDFGILLLHIFLATSLVVLGLICFLLALYLLTMKETLIIDKQKNCYWIQKFFGRREYYSCVKEYGEELELRSAGSEELNSEEYVIFRNYLRSLQGKEEASSEERTEFIRSLLSDSVVTLAKAGSIRLRKAKIYEAWGQSLEQVNEVWELQIASGTEFEVIRDNCIGNLLISRLEKLESERIAVNWVPLKELLEVVFRERVRLGDYFQEMLSTRYGSPCEEAEIKCSESEKNEKLDGFIKEAIGQVLNKRGLSFYFRTLIQSKNLKMVRVSATFFTLVMLLSMPYGMQFIRLLQLQKSVVSLATQTTDAAETAIEHIDYYKQRLGAVEYEKFISETGKEFAENFSDVSKWNRKWMSYMDRIGSSGFWKEQDRLLKNAIRSGERDVEVWALGIVSELEEEGGDYLQDVIPFLSDEDPVLRQRAALALGNTSGQKDKDIIVPLLEGLQSGDPEVAVRAAAEQALSNYLKDAIGKR